MSEKSDNQLVEATLGGDVESFTGLCKRYYPAMVAIAQSILSDRHLAEDAAQEAFARASRNLLKLKKLDHFAGWLATICRNTARDMARNIGSGPQEWPIGNPDEWLAGPADTSQADDHIEAVRKAIGKLSPAAKEIVFLRYYDGMTYQQISAVLGISEQAINGRLRRAKKAIAENLLRNAEIEVRL